MEKNLLEEKLSSHSLEDIKKSLVKAVILNEIADQRNVA